jgi:S-adenosylmethionine:tRNA ribosyltransferase-isomerase
LLLLIAAFLNEENNWRSIYQHALDNNYRFLSYGDSSILFSNNRG